MIFVPVETGMNILQSANLLAWWRRNCIRQEIATAAVLSAVWDSCGQLLPGVCSIEVVVHSVYLFQFLLQN